jgi:hypothetical protein
MEVDLIEAGSELGPDILQRARRDDAAVRDANGLNLRLRRIHCQDRATMNEQ